MREAARVLEALETLPVSVSILDHSGKIVAVNDVWRDFGRKGGLSLPNFGIGSNYLQYCQSDEPYSRRFAKELKMLLAGRLDLLTLVYPCHSPNEKRWFFLIGLPLSSRKLTGVAILHVNLTRMLPLQVGGHPEWGKANRQIRRMHNLESLRDVMEHSVLSAISSQVDAMLLANVARPMASRCKEADQRLARARLSKRQMEVLRLLGEGKTNSEIAGALCRSPNTIKLHVSAILKRLQFKSRTQAALFSSGLFSEETHDLVGGQVMSWKNTDTAAA